LVLVLALVLFLFNIFASLSKNSSFIILQSAFSNLHKNFGEGHIPVKRSMGTPIPNRYDILDEGYAPANTFIAHSPKILEYNPL